MTIAMIIFGLVFDLMILKSSVSIEAKILIGILATGVVANHYLARSKIEEAFRNEILSIK
jgi:hypothetical protein